MEVDERFRLEGLKNVAAFLEVNISSIKRWVKEDPPLPIADSAKEGGGDEVHIFDMRTVRRWYQDRSHKNLTAGKDGKVLDLNKERARQAAEMADGQAIKNAVLRGELLPLSVIEDYAQNIASPVTSKLQSIPGFLRSKTTMTNSQITKVESILAEILNEIAETRPDRLAG